MLSIFRELLHVLTCFAYASTCLAGILRIIIIIIVIIIIIKYYNS